MPTSNLTYRYRVKDSASGKPLQTMALAVPTVWNDCREGCMQAWPRHRGWLRGFDLITLTAGSSKLLGLHSDTIAEGCRSYATRGAPFYTWRLKWRSRQRSLGWVPFKASSCGLPVRQFSFLGGGIAFGCLDRLTGSRKLGA